MPVNLLFVCSKNRLRSPTAEIIFAKKDGFDAIGCGTSKEAECPISADLIEWADYIFVMEKIHQKRIQSAFPSSLKDKKIIVMGIPDDYEFMDETLVDLLESKVARHLK